MKYIQYKVSDVMHWGTVLEVQRGLPVKPLSSTFSKKLYSHCPVLVGSRNRFSRDWLSRIVSVI